MGCPDCGSSLGEYRIASSIETHGLDCGPYERFEQEYIVCRECGGRFDIRDWETSPESRNDLSDPVAIAHVRNADKIEPPSPCRAVFENASRHPHVRSIFRTNRPARKRE